MSDHYQVKFDRKGTMVYGIVDMYSDDAKAAAKKGMVIVADAILPTSYIVPEKSIIDIDVGFGNEYDKHIEAEFNKAQALSDSLEGSNFVGALFGIGVADGTAWYVVTKVKGAKCDVSWRGFCPDRYHDHHYGWGRKNASLADVKRYVDRRKGLNAIFGRMKVTG